jgi:hypothetical protein
MTVTKRELLNRVNYISRSSRIESRANYQIESGLVHCLSRHFVQDGSVMLNLNDEGTQNPWYEEVKQHPRGG